MIKPQCERKNKDRIISEDRVLIDVASKTPLEYIEDAFLLGTVSDLSDSRMEFFEKDVKNKEEWFLDNSAKNAYKDLNKSPENPILLNNLGQVLLNKGEIKEAIKLFEKILKIKPDYIIALLNLARCYEKEHNVAAAMQIYEKIINVNPNELRALVNKGNLLLQAERVDEAKEIFETAINIDPKNVSAIDRLALINLVKGDYKRAIFMLKQCLKFASNLPAVYNNLGIAYSAVGNFRKANSSFKIALKVSPTYRTAIINFAKFLQKIKKYKEVISMLEGYLERKEDLEMREILARVYFSMGQYGKTEMILKRIIDNPFKLILSSQEYGRLYNNLGVTYHKKGNLLEAGKAYYMSEEQGGYNSPIIISNLIDLNFDKKNLEQAEKYIGILHKNFKEEKSYYYQMGRSRLYRGDLQDAIKFLLLSIEKHDNFLPAYPLLSCMYSERLEDYKSAIKLNEYGAKIFPKSEGIINNLAYNYLMVGDIAKAKTILNKIPDNECTLHLYATKGLLAIKEGDIKEGSRLYNLASKMAETLFGKDLRGQVLQKKNLELGKYYLSVGNKNEAKDHFSKAVTFNAKEKYYLEQAQALLKSL